MDNLLQREIAKYQRLYEQTDYRMGERRYRMACQDLQEITRRESYLDVGCGRGEMLRFARQIGFGLVQGTEVVGRLLGGGVVYGDACRLPFANNSWQVVSMFDVLEHLPPGMDEQACLELKRVARRHILLTANNKPSSFSDFMDVGSEDDQNLHINIMPYERWQMLLERWFHPARVKRLQPYNSNLARWRIDL
jgi:SAM-dependent methyltransferase